jgi:hypothetical protein
LQGGERFGCLLFARNDLLSELGQPLAYRSSGERTTAAALSLAMISIDVPLGANSALQTEQ